MLLVCCQSSVGKVRQSILSRKWWHPHCVFSRNIHTRVLSRSCGHKISKIQQAHRHFALLHHSYWNSLHATPKTKAAASSSRWSCVSNMNVALVAEATVDILAKDVTLTSPFWVELDCHAFWTCGCYRTAGTEARHVFLLLLILCLRT